MKMFMVYTKEGTRLGIPVYAKNKSDAISQAYMDEDWVDYVAEVPKRKRKFLKNYIMRNFLNKT